MFFTSNTDLWWLCPFDKETIKSRCIIYSNLIAQPWLKDCTKRINPKAWIIFYNDLAMELNVLGEENEQELIEQELYNSQITIEDMLMEEQSFLEVTLSEHDDDVEIVKKSPLKSPKITRARKRLKLSAKMEGLAVHTPSFPSLSGKKIHPNLIIMQLLDNTAKELNCI